MSGFMTKSMLGALGATAALLVGLSGPAVAQGPPGNNPGQPFEEILAAIGILNDKIDALPGPGATGPCDIPPVWGKKIAGADRFVAVLDGSAYCDQETGLVWEGAPDIIGGPNNNGTRNWVRAIGHCANLEVDGRKGWQLPLREQLASLVDTTGTGVDGNGNPVKLPDGHPFQDVQSAPYWAASVSVDFPLAAWLVGFSSGFVTSINKGNSQRAWCVRGAQSFDGNTHETVH
jgi:hypothetical protein